MVTGKMDLREIIEKAITEEQRRKLLEHGVCPEAPKCKYYQNNCNKYHDWKYVSCVKFKCNHNINDPNKGQWYI